MRWGYVKMNDAMDVMLRFGFRDARLEAELEARGYGIIIPGSRKRRHTEYFQIALLSGEQQERDDWEFANVVEEVRTRLLSLRECLLAARCGEQPQITGLDFGVSVEVDSIFLRNHRFGPAFLALLAELRITLNVSVYANFEAFAREKEAEKAAREANQGQGGNNISEE